MTTRTSQPWAGDAWRLVRLQHGVVARRQLLALGMPAAAIRHRLETGRLHELHRGVYAYGRPAISRLGHLMAAVLAGGPGAQLSHRSAADLWGIRTQRGGLIDVTVSSGVCRARAGIKLHRRTPPPRRFVSRIPVGNPISVLIDLASELPVEEVEDAVNAADRLGLVLTPDLRNALDHEPRRPGTGRLRGILDSQTFSRSQTALERRFLSLVRRAGLPLPTSQQRLGRYRVDFHWPQLALVVETDSLTYHRTVADQATDLRRDQTHARAGLLTVRFNHAQVFRQPAYVREVLTDTFRHLGRARQGPAG